MVDIPVFTFETLYCWGEVVIRPDDEQRTEILLNNSQVNYPDVADKEYCHMLLELVKTAVFHLYISKDKTSGMENEEYSDNNGDSIQNMLHIALSVATKFPQRWGECKCAQRHHWRC